LHGAYLILPSKHIQQIAIFVYIWHKVVLTILQKNDTIIIEIHYNGGIV
jgi:hypothetical protein